VVLMGWAPHDRVPAWLATLLHPPRPDDSSPVAAVTASSDAAARDIRLSLMDGEVAALDEGEV